MEGNNLAIVLLVVGLLVGCGVGYFMAPREVATSDTQPVVSSGEIPLWISASVGVIGVFACVLNRRVSDLQTKLRDAFLEHEDEITDMQNKLGIVSKYTHRRRE